MIRNALALIFVIATLQSCAFLADIFGLRPQSIPIGDYSYTIEHTDRLVQRAMRKLDIPGVAAALIDDQDVVYERAYGIADLSTGAPVTVDTVFKAGSIAKVFTGIEIMRMYEEGLIDIDAPLSAYLPEFNIQTRWPAAPPITLRSILTHRSGLPRNDSLVEWYWDSRPDVLAAIVATGGELHQAFPPDSRYKYSNFAYNVLGRLIEVVRGAVPPAQETAGGFPYHMERELFDPLGMSNSGFGSKALMYGDTGFQDAATGYYQQDGSNTPYNQFDIIDMASGNLFTTLHDLERFIRFLHSDGAIDGARLIAEETLALMYEVQSANPLDPQTNGLTWFTDTVQLSELVVFHSGTCQGAKSLIAFLPERKVGLVLLGNADGFEEVHHEIAFELLALMVETKYGVRPPKRRKPVAVNVDTDLLKTYEGTYVVNSDVIDVSASVFGLRARYKGFNVALTPISSTRFRANSLIQEIDDIEMSFIRDEVSDSRIMILTLGGSYHITCPEYPSMADGEPVPPSWQELVGTYDVTYRHPSIYGEQDPDETVVLLVSENVLRSSDGKILLPLDETRVQIIGGIFDGEIMEYDGVRRELVWQHAMYRRE